MENDLRRLRERDGLTQQQLAERAGITRQTLSALEAGRSVPSTAIALRLARALGCRVEDLFWLEDETAEITAQLAASPPRGRRASSRRVVLGRVGDAWVAHVLDPERPTSLLTAADGIAGELEGSPAHGQVAVQPLAPLAELRDNLLIAGCDPALGVFAQRLGARLSGARVRWVHASSGAALAMLRGGETHIAGAHILDEESGEYNVPLVQRMFPARPMLIVNLSRWEQGLVVRPGNPLGVRSPVDLLRPDVRFVSREPGAGARKLIERLLREHLAPGEGGRDWPVARGHLEVARAVSSGLADAGIALRGAAMSLGLDFVPLAEERFDLVVPAALQDDPRVARLLDTLDSRAFRRELASLDGYQADQTGQVIASVGASAGGA